MNDKILLQKISPYNANKNLIVSNQTTGDIITGIIEMQQKYCNDYKKLLPYFEADNLEDTANNVFEYLKNNFKYVIESENLQSLRSPSAIISTGKKIGIDCKQYSLFFAGILSEYIKKYNLKNKLYFRFAGYEGKPIGHVFVYFLDDNKNEIWCDCVLNYLNDRSIEPTKYKDKIINNMALITISGVPSVEGLVPAYESIGKSQQVCGSVHRRMGDNGGESDEQSSVDIAALWASISAMFDNSTGKWKTRFKELVKYTPVDRLLWYITQITSSNNFHDAVQYSQLFQNRSDKGYYDNPDIPYNLAVQWNKIMDKFFGNNNVIMDGAYPVDKAYVYFDLNTVKPKSSGGGNGGGGGNLPTTKAGFNPLLLIGLIAAGAFLFLKPKI